MATPKRILKTHSVSIGGYVPLKEVLERVQKLIEKYGEDAVYYVEAEEVYGDLEVSSYVDVSRLETQEEAENREKWEKEVRDREVARARHILETYGEK